MYIKTYHCSCALEFLSVNHLLNFMYVCKRHPPPKKNPTKQNKTKQKHPSIHLQKIEAFDSN